MSELRWIEVLAILLLIAAVTVLALHLSGCDIDGWDPDDDHGDGGTWPGEKKTDTDTGTGTDTDTGKPDCELFGCVCIKPSYWGEPGCLDFPYQYWFDEAGCYGEDEGGRCCCTVD